MIETLFCSFQAECTVAFAYVGLCKFNAMKQVFYELGTYSGEIIIQ